MNGVWNVYSILFLMPTYAIINMYLQLFYILNEPKFRSCSKLVKLSHINAIFFLNFQLMSNSYGMRCFFCIQIFLCVCVCVLYWAPHMIVAFWIKQLFRIDSVQWSLIFIWMTCSIFFLAYACAWNVTFRTRSLDTF